MTWKKGCLIALGLGVAFIVLAVTLAMFMTSGAAQAGEELLARLGQGDIDDAYHTSSAALRQQETVASFRASVTALGLTDYQSVSWSSRSVENDRGRLEGTVTTRSGGSIPVELELVQENDAWRVLSIRAPRAGVLPESGSSGAPPAPAAPAAAPSTEDLKALTTETLLAFNQAVQTRDFGPFYRQQIADLFREQTSPEALLEAFSPFVEQQIDLEAIRHVEPTFSSQPMVDNQGVLALTGQYPTQPSQVQFDLKYVNESGQWKLLGIQVNVG